MPKRVQGIHGDSEWPEFAINERVHLARESFLPRTKESHGTGEMLGMQNAPELRWPNSGSGWPPSIALMGTSCLRLLTMKLLLL